MSQILRPDQVRQRYGEMFCQGFFTMVDEKAGRARIVEVCQAKGPKEWDIVNRRRTGGIIRGIREEGSLLIMDTVIGDADLRFGAASSELGAQGVYSLKVEGDRVRTKWRGMAGASVGVGAYIPQCPDVIETVYDDDVKIGGGNTVDVEIVSPKLIRAVIGIDDTDTCEKGATWVTGLKMAQSCPYGRFLEHKIIQLNPKAPNKTTNCCSTSVSFAVSEEDLPKLVDYAVDYVRKATVAHDTVVTVFTGLEIPEPLREWSWSAKSVLYTVDDARRVAEENSVRIIEVTGPKGSVGAVAAIGCTDMGLRAAGVPEDFE